MLQADGRFSSAVKRERSTCWRGDAFGAATLVEEVAAQGRSVRVLQLNGEFPCLLFVSVHTLYRFFYGQTLIYVFGIGERCRGGLIGFDFAAGSASVWRGDIAVLTGFCLGRGVGGIGRDAFNGNFLPVLQMDGRFSSAVKRERSTCWRGDACDDASTLVVEVAAQGRSVRVL